MMTLIVAYLIVVVYLSAYLLGQLLMQKTEKLAKKRIQKHIEKEEFVAEAMSLGWSEKAARTLLNEKRTVKEIREILPYLELEKEETNEHYTRN